QGEQMAVPPNAVRFPGDAISKSPFAHSDTPIPEKEELEARARDNARRLRKEYNDLGVNPTPYKKGRQSIVDQQIKEEVAIIESFADTYSSEKFREFEEKQKALAALSCVYIQIN